MVFLPENPTKLTRETINKGIELRTISISANCQGGYVQLHWRNSGSTGDYDYVGLYDHYPNDPYGYLPDQWQWAVRGNSYVTGTPCAGTFYVAYGSWDYATDKYVIIATSGPFRLP